MPSWVLGKEGSHSAKSGEWWRCEIKVICFYPQNVQSEQVYGMNLVAI
jgi:hypothetical protein